MPRPAPARDMRTTLLLCGAGIAAAALAVYARGLGGLFLYDDVDSIVGNASIRHFSAALLPPAGLTVSGRPVLNLSFAINYAVSGAGAWSYHALNIAIHGAAALALFGIVRRTLATPLAGSRSEGECLGIASAVAPPAGLTVSGRPVLNLSFAINYAVSGAGAWSYHALNIAIHGAAALALFGIAMLS